MTAATANVLVDLFSPKVLAVASPAEAGTMSDDEGDSPGPPAFTRMRYALVLLNKHGEWRDLRLIYAVDDAEALAVSKFLADGWAFELWHGSRCVGDFSSTEH